MSKSENGWWCGTNLPTQSFIVHGDSVSWINRSAHYAHLPFEGTFSYIIIISKTSWEIGLHGQEFCLPSHLIDRMHFSQAKAVFLKHLKRNEWKFHFKPNTLFPLQSIHSSYFFIFPTSIFCSHVLEKEGSPVRVFITWRPTSSYKEWV